MSTRYPCGWKGVGQIPPKAPPSGQWMKCIGDVPYHRCDRAFLREQEQRQMTAFWLGGIIAFLVVALGSELAERIALWIAR